MAIKKNSGREKAMERKFSINSIALGNLRCRRGRYLPLWEPLLFAALLFGICYLNIRSKVGAIFKSSIVENIREL